MASIRNTAPTFPGLRGDGDRDGQQQIVVLLQCNSSLLVARREIGFQCSLFPPIHGDWPKINQAAQCESS
jgi:hypothetical protein